MLIKFGAIMSGNSILNHSKSAKNNDEFYTTYESVDGELPHYAKQLKNKTILCNCDDPFESNFSKYFIRNFNSLKLKGLICTSYKSSKVIATHSNLTDNKGKLLSKKYGYVLSITNVPKHITITSSDEQIEQFLNQKGIIQKLKGDGDFRSKECVEYLKKADVIITNPPFSLFRELVSLIMQYNKSFLLIGNSNAITYKEIFPLIKNNQAWLGYHNGDMAFRVPNDSEARKTRFWIDDTGQKWRSLGNAMWFTNIDIKRRHQKLLLTKKYQKTLYPKYDEYDAIEVSRVADIPIDYQGIMAVPITFLNKYNPDQFIIIGEANHGSDNPFDIFKPTIKGKLIYKRILIKWRNTYGKV